MTTAPHFSIIIPSYNNLALLKDCLDSINSQTFKGFEVWIIDNDSNDGTQEYLTSLKPPFHFISKKDSGIYNAMNLGIKNSQGSWLYFMGADDKLYDTNVLNRIASVENNGCQLITGRVVFEAEDKTSKIVQPKISKFSRIMWFKNTVHHQGVFYSRRLFENRLYDENYKVLADYKLNLGLYQQNKKISETESIIATCGNQGISKKFEWSLYKEDIRLKTELSSIILKPVFWIVGYTKYLIKKN